MKQKNVYEREDQIVYVPNHAMVDGEPDMEHPDIEYGFVTSHNVELDTVFCRYWQKGETYDLRTKANSEGANIWNIFLFEYHDDQGVIDAAMLSYVLPSEDWNDKILQSLLDQ